MMLLSSAASLSTVENGGWFKNYAVDVFTGLCGVLQFERRSIIGKNLQPRNISTVEGADFVSRLSAKLRRAAACALALICSGNVSTSAGAIIGRYSLDSKPHLSFSQQRELSANSRCVAELLGPLVHGGHLKDLREVLVTVATDATEDSVVRQHASDALDGISLAVPGIIGTTLHGHSKASIRGRDAHSSGATAGLMTIVSSKRLVSGPV